MSTRRGFPEPLPPEKGHGGHRLYGNMPFLLRSAHNAVRKRLLYHFGKQRQHEKLLHFISVLPKDVPSSRAHQCLPSKCSP